MDRASKWQHWESRENFLVGESGVVENFSVAPMGALKESFSAGL